MGNPGRRDSPWRAGAVCIIASIVGLAAPLPAQHPIIFEGARIRITWTEPAEWLHGTIERPASRDLSIHAAGARADTRLMLDDRTRLQIHRGRRSHPVPGAIIGGVLGAAVSTLLFSDAFGTEGTFFASSQAAFAGGLAGLAIGAITSVAGFGEDQWQDVPVRNGRIVFPPLESGPGGLRGASFQARLFWERFDILEAAFVAFFQEYRQALDPVEGLFVRTNGFGRFALARDSMFEGYRYVMVNLEPPTTLSQPQFGQILGGLFLDAQTGEYVVRHINARGTGVARAALNADQLTLEMTDGDVSLWERRAPVSDEEPAPPPRPPQGPPQGGPTKKSGQSGGSGRQGPRPPTALF